MTKTQILQEIKRTTEANGGTPLGLDRFENETGIKQYDWLKFWPRWSEAIREAGYAPNSFINAYDEAELLDRYAKLVQEVGKIPVRGDLSVKAHADPSFPSEKAFRRFGGKEELIRRLAAYCKGRIGYEQVVRLCENYDIPNRSTFEQPDVEQGEIGFVYLTKSGRFHKIGKTNDVGRRRYELAIQLAEKATTVHVIRTDDPTGIEAYWHNRFASKRANGEWFALNAADIAAFKRRKFM
jgi:Meiotically up-regulated gene 113